MRPNIIIFNPDEMRADTMGHLGNKAASTPFLDSIIRDEAVSFRNAYCQNPVCVPSRCSFSTGLYPHVNGHRTMAHLLRNGEESFFSELKRDGYYVWMNARNDLVAGQIPGLMDRHASEIYYGGNKEKTADDPAKAAKPGTEDFNAMYRGIVPSNEDGINYTDDDEDLDAAIEAIRNKPQDKPLCLFLGLVYPHPTYKVEEKYYSRINKNELPKRVHPEDCTGKSDIMTEIRKNQKLSGYTEEQWTELRTTYLGMVSKIDDQFKKLCDALKEAGEYDNSAIFFMSDHGDFAGDYGLAEKAQNTFEDCLTNVPFLVKPPKGFKLDAGISDNMVELVDLYATVMDFAQVQPCHTQYGRSLIDAVGDRNVRTRDFVTCEGGRNPEEIHCDEFHSNGPKGTSPFNPYYPRHLAQSDNDAHAKGYMLRTDRYKLVLRVNGKDEFYDLKCDPKETKNLMHEVGYENKIAALKSDLCLWLMRTADIVPMDYDKRFSEEMIWAKVKELVPAEYEEEIRAKIKNGANMYMLKNECMERFANNK